jgi:hypothetical protein
MQRPPEAAQISGAGNIMSPSPAKNGRQPPVAIFVRPTLPDRNVTGATIEDAYVRFILYCNPAVPLDVDTAELREAFRTPPKSEGKTFSSYVLFELIKQLDSKTIKTWAELAVKLGVEPPDHDKSKKQSSQKIQQYAVRLKVCYLCQAPNSLTTGCSLFSAMDAVDARGCLLRVSHGPSASLLDPDSIRSESNSRGR